MAALRQLRSVKVSLLAALFAVALAGGPALAADVTTPFSDPNANTIYRWAPDGQVSVFRTKSGYTGIDIGEYGPPGSNGLALDREARLTIAEHGNRRVTRLEKTGALTVLADRYQGKRLNSPNDLVYYRLRLGVGGRR